ncbi:MAG: response regulator, partial [Cytophagaceae bacterium]
TPVLMLTALDTLEDKIRGFDAGADDYLPKPFAFKELLLRLRAITKRHMLRHSTVLRLADLTLNMDTKVVIRAEKRIELTSKEFALLEYMLLHKGKVISRAELAERVWETDFDSNTNVIDVYVNYLRKKIDKEFPAKLVHTVIGMGYSLHE